MTKFYLVTESSDNIEKILRISLLAIDLGIEYLQIRNEVIDYQLLKRLSIEIIKYRRNTQIIINDYVELAAELDADGTHIGQGDMSVLNARKILGNNKIIGLSIENMHQANQANELPIDYIAASPVFASKTKLDAAKPLGLSGLKEIGQMTKLPIFAIGGITSSNCLSVIKNGARGLCFVSEIFDAENPKEKILEIKKLIT
jgi:thiamine-phosphate pyrophosphorylase